MTRWLIEDLASLVSISLFVAMILSWASIIEAMIGVAQ